MSRKRQLFIAIGLGIIGLLGMAVVVTGQGAPAVSIQQQYQQRWDKIDKDNPDELYELAKWCYQNGLVSEAMTHALAAHAKAPDDTRPKYLLYALTSDTGESTTAQTEETAPSGTPSMTAADADALFKSEGADVMREFKKVQSVLLARCGSAKCHGGQAEGSSKLILISRSPGSRTTMAQNFLAIDPYITRGAPGDLKEAATSPLLQIPMKVGDSKHPLVAIRGATDPVYQTLLTWIGSLKTEANKMREREEREREEREREKAKEKPTPNVSDR
jgi:hypothetical protein